MSKTDNPNAARLRITLLDLDPAPWREVEVPLSMTFKGLHDTIQAAFLWFDSHLWEFEFAGRRYGEPYDDGFGDMFAGTRTYKASTTKLTNLRDSKVPEFLYTYDMGDNWQHHIEVLDLFMVNADTALPRFVTGQWRTPPEDIGGAPGFEMFLEAIADPNHEEHDHLLEWYGNSFDREDIEKDIIKIQMKRLASMRRRKK